MRTDFRKVLGQLPVPERLRYDHTEMELEKAETDRLTKSHFPTGENLQWPHPVWADEC